MSSFEDYFFKVPISGNSKSDWHEIIENSDEHLKILRIFQARVCLLVNDLSDLLVTPERIAWIGIWTRTFLMIDSVIRMSEELLFDYPLQILSRVAFEAKLQILSILEPLKLYYQISDPDFPFSTRISKDAEENAWQTVLERLCAYSAYCLFNDKRLLTEVIRPKNLDAIWDPRPVSDILSNPEKYKQYVSLFGPLELQIDLQTDIELKRQKEKQRDYFKKEIERINRWLSHPKLRSSHHKLENNPNMSFFTLINTKEQKIRHQLKELNLEMGILSYGRQSMLIHNSTLESFYLVNDNQVVPRIMQDDKKVEQEAYSIANTCNVIVAFLHLLKSRLWVT